MRLRPIKPIRQFAEKFLVEFGRVEDGAPCVVECGEIGERIIVAQLGQGQIVENFNVRAVGVGETDVFDERHFFQYVFCLVAFMQTAVNDGKGERVSVLEKNQRGHGKEFVHLARNFCQRGARIRRAREFDGKNQIRLIVAAVNAV
ncbi:MAG: hypothetical protein HDKAJFGB_00913 [Anaerolineae bacterium]|nr:hypothetical protein [Anaerolineae bacterium]